MNLLSPLCVITTRAYYTSTNERKCFVCFHYLYPQTCINILAEQELKLASTRTRVFWTDIQGVSKQFLRYKQYHK